MYSFLRWLFVASQPGVNKEDGVDVCVVTPAVILEHCPRSSLLSTMLLCLFDPTVKLDRFANARRFSRATLRWTVTVGNKARKEDQQLEMWTNVSIILLLLLTVWPFVIIYILIYSIFDNIS